MSERRSQREPSAARVPTVSRLRREVAELRHELRHAQAVGPAVGVLAARLDCGLDQARERLGSLARAYGVPLDEAAASVVATAGQHAVVPATAEAGSGATPSAVLDSGRILAASAAPHRAALAGHGAPPDQDTSPAALAEALDALAARLQNQLAEPLGPVAVGLLAVAPDGSQQLIGAAGMPAALVGAWGRIPPLFNTASIAAARTGHPRWLPRLDEARRRFVLIGEPEMSWPSRVAVPIHDGDRAVGVAVIFCHTPNEFGPATRQAVTEQVAECGPGLVELLRRYPHHANWVAETQAVLDMLPGAVALQMPIRDGDGKVVDYRVAAASPGAVDVAGRRGRELVGLRALEAYPSLAGGELMQAFAHVLATGQAREIGPFAYVAEQDGVPAEALYSVRAHRHGTGLLISWVRHDEERRVTARLAATERLGNLGWVEWDFTTDTIHWSDQVYEIFGRDRAAGPMPLAEVAARLLPEDLPALEAATSALLHDRRPMDATYRFRVAGKAAGEIRHIRSVFEGEYDAKGRPVRAYGVVQDVSAVAAADRDRRRLADIERQLAERQRTLQTEHRLVTALQQIIMPLPSGPIELPGLRVAVRYQPAEELARVGGDWYDLTSLPCGRTLLAVGDVAGHGITAAATMARLRHALTALAVTTSDPAELLNYLNRMVCDDPAEPTATAVVARYDPRAATITWAQAGHPPPILIADGVAAPVERPAGMVVGARRDANYGTAELRLPADCRLLLYTDGLIERRGRFEADWLAPLAATLAGGEKEPGDVLLGRLRPANPDDDTCMLLLHPLAG